MNYDRSFEAYRKLHTIFSGMSLTGTSTTSSTEGPGNHHRYHQSLSNTKFIQRYGNSYIVKLNKGKGTFIVGPHWPGVLFTVVVILGGTSANLHLLEHNTNWSQTINLNFKVFIYVFCILSISLLLCTATTEPGIVFSNDKSTDDTLSTFNLEQMPYCDVCSVFQPKQKRIGHCDTCNYCIEQLDHHCPWMVRLVRMYNNPVCLYVSSTLYEASIYEASNTLYVSSALTLSRYHAIYCETGPMHWQEEHDMVPALQLHMDPVLRGVHVYRLFRLDALLACIRKVNLRCFCTRTTV